MIRNSLVSLVLLACALSAQPTLFLQDLVSDQLYSVDPATGASTQIGPLVVGGVGPLGGVGLAWNGVDLYTLDLQAGGLWRVDPVTAATTLVGLTNHNKWQDVTWDPVTQQLLGLSHLDRLYSIDLSGNATLLAPTTLGYRFAAMAVDAAGQLWTMNFFSPAELGTMDRATGTFTPVAVTNLTGVLSMDFHPTTNQLYVDDSHTDSLHILDVVTGAFTTLGPNGGTVTYPSGMRFVGGGTTTAASLTPIGLGCVGSNGIAMLAGAGGQLPQIGNATFGFALSSAATNSLAFFYYAGFARSQALQVSPGCFVHLDVPSLVAFLSAGIGPVALPTDAAGVALLAAPIPNDPALAGASLGIQALAIDPGAPDGFTLSNGLQVLLGF